MQKPHFKILFGWVIGAHILRSIHTTYLHTYLRVCLFVRWCGCLFMHFFFISTREIVDVVKLQNKRNKKWFRKTKPKVTPLVCALKLTPFLFHTLSQSLATWLSFSMRAQYYWIGLYIYSVIFIFFLSSLYVHSEFCANINNINQWKHIFELMLCLFSVDTFLRLNFCCCCCWASSFFISS